MPLSLSKRANLIVQSDIRAMTIECDRVGGINLAQGVCDTETPAPVRRAAQAGIEQGINSYTRFDGLGELRRAIAKKMQQFNLNGLDSPQLAAQNLIPYRSPSFPCGV
jgi:aminotransferase